MKSNYWFFVLFVLLCFYQSNAHAQAWVDETTYINKTLYVNPTHPDANDGNTGADANLPLSTINGAASKVGNGTKIIIAPGIYREQIDIHAGSGKLIIMKDPAKTGYVTISGSDIFDSWVSEGNGRYAHYWPYDWGTGLPPANIDDNVFPGDDYEEIEKRREIVFIDNDRYELVLNDSEMAPGKFIVDEANDKITIMPKAGVDIMNSLVEIPIRGRDAYGSGNNGVILSLRAAKGGLILKGIQVKHANNTMMQNACNISWSDNILIENCDFSDNGGVGLSFNNFEGSSSFGTNGDGNVTLLNVTANRNGERGMGTWGGDAPTLVGNMLFENVECKYNNWRFKNNRKVKAWDAAGFKLVNGLKNITFNNCTFSHNYSDGLWFDWHNFLININNSLVEHNERAGITLEASNQETYEYSFRINNTISRYNESGVMGYNATGVEILNSKIYSNLHHGQLYIGGDNRITTGYEANWRGWVIRDSWIISDQPDQALIKWFTHTATPTSPSYDIFSTMDADNNYWYHPQSTLWFPSPVEGAVGSTLTFEEWKAQSGEDASSAWGVPSAWPGSFAPSPQISYNHPGGSVPITIQFDGSNSIDPNGSITSYNWEFGDGTTSTAVNPSHTYSDLGRYRVSLTVQDNEGLTSSVSTTVLVDEITGPNGGIWFEKWNDVAGGTIAEIPLDQTPDEAYVINSLYYSTSSQDSYADRISGYLFPPETGNYTFYISSDDQSEVWLSTSFSPADKELLAFVPSWAPSGDYARHASQKSAEVYLNANEKYYIEVLHKEGSWGDHVEVAWQRPGAGSVDIVPGDYLAYFTSNKSPDITLDNPANDDTFFEGHDVNIEATATDSDGQIDKVEFYANNNLIGTDSIAPYAYLWESVVSGTYSIEVKAIDNEGASEFASVNIDVVQDPNNAPVVSITSPANASAFTPGGSVTIQASAIDNDPDDYVSSVEIYIDGQLVATDTESPYEYVYNSIPSGIHYIQAKAYDSSSKPATSESVMISDQPLTAGELKREIWYNIPGSLVSDIPLTTPPDETGTLTEFDAPRDIADQYGQRVSGYVIPPQDGNYTFWINSDDYSELYLSTNAEQTNKQLIASVPGWAAYNDFNKYPEQQSASIYLEANNIYYIEALHKDNDWGDNLKVKWTLPDGTEESPIATSHLAFFDDNSTPVSVTGVTISENDLELEVSDTYQLSATVEPANAADPSVSWSSSDENVATVDNNGLVSAMSEGTSTITVTTNDGGYTASSAITVNPQVISVTGIAISEISIALNTEEAYQLSALITPTDATDQSVTWNTGDASVATVNSSGLVTAVASGTTIITVTSNDGGFNATCEVSVTLSNIVASTYGNGGIPGTGDPWLVNNSGSIRIEAENYNQGGEGTGYHDSGSNNSGGQYRSSEGVDIQTTSDAGGGYNVGWISAGEWLEYTIDVTETGTYNINMRVARDPSGSSSVRGLFGPDSENLSDKTGTMDVPSTGAWQNWNTITATVSLNAGTQIMRVYMEGGSFNLNWIEIDGNNTQIVPVTGISLDFNMLSLNPGQSQQLTETVYPSNATDKSVNWTSSNETVATVNASGLVSAVAEGTATITASTNDGGYIATCDIEVTPQIISVTGVSLSDNNLQLTAGQTYQLDATVYPSDATNNTVNWSSSNTDIATVNNTGLVTAVIQGMADITVTTDDGSFTDVSSVTVNATSTGNPGEGHLSVYPNPAPKGSQATVTYGWNDAKSLDRIKVEIYDMNGYKRNTFISYENDGDMVIDLVKHWGPALDLGVHTLRMIVYYADGSLHIVNGYNLLIE